MIFDLKHITVKEFYSLEDEKMLSGYFALESMLKPRDNKIGKRVAKNLRELTFGQVGIIKRNISKPTFDSLLECFTLVYGIKKYEYLSLDIVEYFYGLKWLKQEIESIVAGEKKVLQSETVDHALKMAGIDRLNRFGELPSLVILGRSFGMDPETIENWKYQKVFSILAYDKIHGEIQKRYNEIKSKN